MALSEEDRRILIDLSLRKSEKDLTAARSMADALPDRSVSASYYSVFHAAQALFCSISLWTAAGKAVGTGAVHQDSVRNLSGLEFSHLSWGRYWDSSKDCATTLIILSRRISLVRMQENLFKWLKNSHSQFRNTFVTSSRNRSRNSLHKVKSAPQRSTPPTLPSWTLQQPC